jgi:hypothetical protein
VPDEPVVVLSGALGSGKTTLGRRLVKPLRATLLSKDLLKESMDEPQLVALNRRLVQIFCSAPGSILRARVLSRVESGERHAVHRDGMVPELLERIASKVEAGTARPLDLPCPLIEVDTSGDVDLDALLARLRVAIESADA